MDIAVLSDIHGNHCALERCIEYAIGKNIHTFIFLGDYLGELAYPQKTMKIIYTLAKEYTCNFIKGNKEDYWLQYSSNGEVGWSQKDSTTGCLLYTYQNLTKEDIEFFREMKIADSVYFEDLPGITIYHGSARKTNEKMLMNDNTYALIDSDKNNLILCGHTHICSTIGHNEKILINPGSVGVPLHSSGQAQFLILHGNNHKWESEFVSIKYNVDKAIQELSESGLESMAPCWCEVTKHLLRTGEITHSTVLRKAMEYCSEELGDCHWPNIPEKYWIKAVNELL